MDCCAALDDERLLLDAMTEGLSSVVLSRLLAHARAWVQRRFGMKLDIERPFYPRSGLVALSALDHGPEGRNVTPGSLILFDADGMRRVSLARATRVTIA